MFGRRSNARASLIAVRALAALLTISTTAVGCASLQSAAGIHPRPTIAFENATNEPVRVYLIESAGGHYLLGNVQAMERAALRVPAHMGLTESRQVSLVVVPMSRGAFGPVTPAMHTSSPMVGSVMEIVTMRWVMTASALHYDRNGNVSVVR